MGITISIKDDSSDVIHELQLEDITSETPFVRAKMRELTALVDGLRAQVATLNERAVRAERREQSLKELLNESYGKTVAPPPEITSRDATITALRDELKEMQTDAKLGRDIRKALELIRGSI